MRCLHFLMWSAQCRLCWVYNRNLRQRSVEHKNSAIGKHLAEAQEQLGNPKEGQFRLLRKCQTKIERLIYEMLFIKKIKPSLNTQAD